MKKKAIAIGCIILVIIGLVFLLSSSKDENIVISQNEVVPALIDQVSSQEKINNKLSIISKSDKYTLKNPYVELNPYGISPLSAVIIFKTEKEQTINIMINNDKVTTMEKSKNHVIPIYGLLANYTNKIVISNEEESKEITIKTDKSTTPSLDIIKKNNDKSMLFTVSKYLKAYDKDGKIRFYLTVDNRMDVEWLDNEHFLIGISAGEYAENFVSFVEMDYLGKIYNYYIPENGYSFEFQVLKNGNYMISGGNNPVYIDEQIVYEINPNNGKKIKEINLSKIIKEIDSNFNDDYLGQKAIRNAFYYNENNNELLVSFRGMDAIFSFNYKTNKLNYVFTDIENELFQNDVWQNYLVKLASGRYPLGIHSVRLTKDGNVAFFNNGYNRLHGFENGGNDLVKYYHNNYSSAEIYKINNKVATLINSYDFSKKYFSHQYGSIMQLENENYLINFGYNLKDDYRKNENATLSEAENNTNYIYSKIIEVDKNSDVVYEANLEDGSFRSFKHHLYNDITKNVDINSLNIYNRVKKDKYQTYKINDNIKNSSDWIYSSIYTQNTFTTNYEIGASDEINLLFVHDADVYSFNYKDKSVKKSNKIFNYKLKKGKYHLYIELNNVVYNTHKIVEY